jgi:hypothetical protein
MTLEEESEAFQARHIVKSIRRRIRWCGTIFVTRDGLNYEEVQWARYDPNWRAAVIKIWFGPEFFARPTDRFIDQYGKPVR